MSRSTMTILPRTFRMRFMRWSQFATTSLAAIASGTKEDFDDFSVCFFIAEYYTIL